MSSKCIKTPVVAGSSVQAATTTAHTPIDLVANKDDSSSSDDSSFGDINDHTDLRATEDCSSSSISSPPSILRNSVNQKRRFVNQNSSTNLSPHSSTSNQSNNKENSAKKSTSKPLPRLMNPVGVRNVGNWACIKVELPDDPKVLERMKNAIGAYCIKCNIQIPYSVGNI